MSPPKSLDDLLREFDSLQISSPSDRAAIDKAIEANKWAKKVQSRFGIFCLFRHFLVIIRRSVCLIILLVQSRSNIKLRPSVSSPSGAQMATRTMNGIFEGKKCPLSDRGCIWTMLQLMIFAAYLPYNILFVVYFSHRRHMVLFCSSGTSTCAAATGWRRPSASSSLPSHSQPSPQRPKGTLIKF